MHTLIADFKRMSNLSSITDSTKYQGSTTTQFQSDIDQGGSSMDIEGALIDKEIGNNNEIGGDKESAARREWSIAAESTLIILQQSNLALHYSPLVIAVAALKTTEPTGSLGMTLDTYLSKRFGESSITLLKEYESMTETIESARVPIDLVFLISVCMERLKKESVWSKAKVKKPKGGSQVQVPEEPTQ